MSRSYGRPAPSLWPGITGGIAPPPAAARSTPGDSATSAVLSMACASARRTRSSAIGCVPTLKPRNVVESVGERSEIVSVAAIGASRTSCRS